MWIFICLQLQTACLHSRIKIMYLLDLLENSRCFEMNMNGCELQQEHLIGGRLHPSVQTLFQAEYHRRNRAEWQDPGLLYLQARGRLVHTKRNHSLSSKASGSGIREPVGISWIRGNKINVYFTCDKLQERLTTCHGRNHVHTQDDFAFWRCFEKWKMKWGDPAVVERLGGAKLNQNWKCQGVPLTCLLFPPGLCCVRQKEFRGRLTSLLSLFCLPTSAPF